MDFDIDREKIIMEKDNQNIECDILFTFDSEDSNKVYVGYTDNTIASNGRKNIYVSSYDPFNSPSKLEDITDEAELAMIRDVLKEIDSEDSKGMK